MPPCISRALPDAYPECIAAPGNEFDELSEPAASCFLFRLPWEVPPRPHRLLEALHAGICLGIFVAVVLEGGVAVGL
jgi:hypothetical protein